MRVCNQLDCRLSLLLLLGFNGAYNPSFMDWLVRDASLLNAGSSHMSSKRRVPQDITNLLAHCIRDLIWYKNNVFSFLEECGVPRSVMIEVRREKDKMGHELKHFLTDGQLALTSRTRVSSWYSARNYQRQPLEEAYRSG